MTCTTLSARPWSRSARLVTLPGSGRRLQCRRRNDQVTVPPSGFQGKMLARLGRLHPRIETELVQGGIGVDPGPDVVNIGPGHGEVALMGDARIIEVQHRRALAHFVVEADDD